MLIKIKKEPTTFSEILCVFLFYCSLLQFISPMAHYVFAGMMVIGGLLLFSINIGKRIICKSDIIITLVIEISIILNVIFVEQLDILNLIIIVCAYVPIAIYLHSNDKYNFTFWKCALMILSFFMFAWWILNGAGLNVFYIMSRNYVSILLVIYLLVVEYVGVERNKHCSIWMIMFTVIASFMTLGRAGIIMAVYMLAMYYFYYAFISKNKSNYTALKKVFGFFGLIIISIVVLFNMNKICMKFFSRFVDGSGTGSDYIRSSITNSYINSLKTPRDWFLGVNTKNLSSFLIENDGNLHNSYFMLQASLGIVITCVFVISALYCCVKLIKRKKFELFILLSAFLLRISTDSVMPMNIGMIVALICIFTFFSKPKIKVRI